VNLEFLRNRVHEVGAGLLYRKAEVPRDLHGVVDGNTFHAVQTGLLFESLPPAAEGANWLWVRHNLFVQVPRLTAVAGFQTEPATVAGHWIWADEGNPAAEAPKGVRYFRKRFDLAQVPAGPVLLNVVCDDAGAVFLNGQPIIHPRWDVQPRRVYAVDVRDKLRPGANVLAVEAENTGGPAGLFVQLQAAAAAPLAVTDGGWRYQAQKAANWEKPEFAEEGWSPVKDLGPYRPAPNPAWANLLWDAEVLRQRGSLSPLLTNQSKNFHDGKGVDGYPFVLAAPVEVTLYTNPLQDAKFLRYDYYHPLRDAGENKAPVGVPMD
jgi:hypothetical protein